METTESVYGLGALIKNGDFVTYSTLAILIIMSLLTWFIMITKFFDQGRLRRQANEAEKEFWSSTQAQRGFQPVPRARRNRQARL
jgi:biopolymer transport protein ExbB